MILQSILPSAINMGVDYELFWRLNPKKLEPFMAAYNKRLETENYMNWLNGIYTLNAIASVLGSNHQYPDEAFKLFPEKEDEERKRIKDSELFEAYAMMFNKEFAKKQKR